MAAADELVFVALGGVGEIGMNLALYGYGRGRDRKWLAVDMGVAFGHEECCRASMPCFPTSAFCSSARRDARRHRDHATRTRIITAR